MKSSGTTLMAPISTLTIFVRVQSPSSNMGGTILRGLGSAMLKPVLLEKWAQTVRWEAPREFSSKQTIRA